jgi:nucleotide-binding universal stress UspA family protein
MYRKVLIPLDGSKEAEMVIPKIQPELTEDAEVVLLKITPPLEGEMGGPIRVTSTQQEEAERVNAIDYLREVIQRLGGSSSQWRCDAVVRESVAEGIATLPTRRGWKSLPCTPMIARGWLS